ncbi:MAG: phage tail spike protein [Anaerococcus vaginalis]|uniref:phage tail spike protein n=1 Tax=Anaerococcus vaginalis TaxID=33037 RepID=UPI0029114C7C|nr:phage tail spike protein [Anaerococcus vaginalis]MDU5086763.1 phage tail spike protein [Anaerococcus vaginalis]
MLYLFDKNENLIHELASNEIESLIQHEELNKLMTLEFSVFIDSNDKMKDIEYVAHKDMEDYQKIQMYRIISSESDDYTVNYQAVHIIFDELKAYGYIRDKRPDKVKASSALDIALAGSRWKVGRVDDSQLLSTNFYDSTRLDALSKIIKNWNLDLHFYLTFDGNKITGRYVDLLGFRGEDTGERFVYGSNALEVIKEVDVSEVYTRVIPRGKGEEKTDEKGKPTDGYGRRIKIDDVIWEKSKGDPIDKPKGQEYLELKEMTNKFGFSDGEARTRVQIFEDIEDPKELIKAGYDFLVKVSRPLVQFKTKISKRSRTNVGDIVRIIRKDLDFYYRTRIYKAHRNLLNETLEVEFGDKLVQSPADREKIVSDNLNALENRLKETETDLKSSFVDKVVEGITYATFNRDGYNYELKKGNKYGLPAGYYSFDREIDDNPQRVIYVGAGTLSIADSKKSNGDWNFRTFGTGQGFVADLLVAGTILGGNVRWNLEDGTFLIGKNADDYSMYWDGSTLHFRNVDINLKNSKDFSQIKDDLDKKISKEDVLEDAEIQEALKGKDGLPGEKGKDGQDGKPGKDGKTGKIGQNLLRNSNVPVENKDYNTKEWTLCEIPEAGETMTFTVKVKLEKDDKLMLFNSGGMISLNWWTEVSKSKDYVIYTSTFDWRDKFEYNGKIYEQTNPPTLKLYTQSNGNGENFNNNTVSLEWATLSRGDIPAIEWSPCYADVDDAIKAGKEETEEVSKKLIKVESDFKIDSNNIKASVSSLTKTTERSFVNLKKDMADADVKVETGIKNYIINNYSTKTQTDQKISQEVGSIKASIGSINKEISRTKTSIEQTNSKIESKVSKDKFSSLVKQEFDSYKVQARNINFDGYVSVKGEFTTNYSDGHPGINIKDNAIEFFDKRVENRHFGRLVVTENINLQDRYSLSLGHYNRGSMALTYKDPNKDYWNSYVSFDKFNHFGNNANYPIIFYEGTLFKHWVRFDNGIWINDTMHIRSYADGLAILNNANYGLFITKEGGVYVMEGVGKTRKL